LLTPFLFASLIVVSGVLGEALDAGLHLISANNSRADGTFFERLEKDVGKLHERAWVGATVLKRHHGGGKTEDKYDIEFEDGAVAVRVKRGMLRKWRRRGGGGGESDDEEEEEEEEEVEEEEEEESGDEEEGKMGELGARKLPKYRKPKTFEKGAKVLARREDANPGPTKYNAFRAEDPRCGPVVIRKLDRRIKAIRGYLDGNVDQKGGRFPETTTVLSQRERDKRSPLTPLLYAYARQRRDVIEMMEHCNLKWEEEKGGEGKDDDDDEDDDEV